MVFHKKKRKKDRGTYSRENARTRDNIRENGEFASEWTTGLFWYRSRNQAGNHVSARNRQDWATRRGRHAAAIVPDLQLTRDAARRVCASLAPAHRILIPLRPLTGHSQLVSLSLPSRVSVYLAFFRPRFSLVPRFSPSFLAHSLPSLSTISIRPFPPLSTPLSLSHPLIPASALTRELLSLLCGPLSRCSCLLTHSLLQFFRRSLCPSRRDVSPSPPFFLPFTRGKRSCSHPSSGFLSIPPIQLSTSPSPPALLRSSRLSVFHPLPRSHPPSPPHI